MILRCPKCNEELEIPDKCVGWKVQCIYCNEKFFATEEFINKQKEALKKKTLRIPPVKRKEEPKVIVIKRPSGASPKSSTATRSRARGKGEGAMDALDRALDRAAHQSKALREANGWSVEDIKNKIRNGQLSLVMGDDGCYDLVVNACTSDVGDKLVNRIQREGAKPPERKPGVTIVDGIEVPDGSPFWMYIPSWLLVLTFPLWAIPYLLWIIVRPLNPNYESMHDKMVRLGIEEDDDAWSYAERERWQWTLGTGRYANND